MTRPRAPLLASDGYRPEIERDESGRAVRLYFSREAPPAQPEAEEEPREVPLCGVCRKPVLPRAVRGGKPKKWCSPACGRLAWERAHPEKRQGLLRFEGPGAGWTPAQREQSAHLDKRESRKARMLARLQQGEATTWELMALGGAGFSSRLAELRRDGHRVSCESHLDFAIYRLEESA